MQSDKIHKTNDVNNIQGKRVFFQSKLYINQPNDIYEQEADAVADHVMRMHDNATNNNLFFRPSITSVQRKCAHCEEEEKQVQLKENNGDSFAVPSQTEQYINALSGGSSLHEKDKNFFESKMGYDFGNVKLHTGSNAEQSSRAINARAYTTGNNIVFNKGEYAPATDRGKRLLAHELTHVVQQSKLINNVSAKMIQADLSIEPTTPNRPFATLSAAQVANAVSFNQARHTDVTEIALIRDVLGISKTPSVIDDDFVNAVARYQAQFGLTQDGRLGHGTADMLAKEVIAENGSSMPVAFASLAPEFALQTAIERLITANNRTYTDYKATILGATMLQQHVALQNQVMLTSLKGQLSWNNFARCVELLGRIPPTGNELLQNTTIRAALNTAFAASNAGVTRWDAPIAGHALAPACNPLPGAAAPAAHEEGGWVYLNLITGNLITRRAAPGAQAGINVNTGAPLVSDSVMIATFHTHPNVGPCWGVVTPSGADTTNAGNRGLPNLIQGAFPAIANIQRVVTGPNSRNHLAGNRLIPGAAGGLTPQADITGREGLE